MNTGLSWIERRILESRMGDKPELTDEEYINHVLNNVVSSPSPGIVHGFVTSVGGVIGYTSESSGNIHYILASLACGEHVPNPLYFMDYVYGSIKIKSEKSFRMNNPVTFLSESQVSSWRLVLGMTGEKMFNLGWGHEKWFTLGEISQMDLYTLDKHLTD